MTEHRDRYERRRQRRELRKQEAKKARRGKRGRTLLTVAGGLAVVALVIGGLVLYGTRQKVLPPTDFGPTHSESLPAQQVNTQPIPRPIQEHVMEHVGNMGPGILVQYNCQDYQCEPDLVPKLTEVVRSYPPRVFLAPYPGMDAKIALAAPGELEVLETFDEGRVRQFIESNLR
ncbi:MAG: DUF3105 domain-containing protein [Dehalococcoidia bacterium]